MYYYNDEKKIVKKKNGNKSEQDMKERKSLLAKSNKIVAKVNTISDVNILK